MYFGIREICGIRHSGTLSSLRSTDSPGRLSPHEHRRMAWW